MTLSKLVVRNIVRRRGRFVFTLLGITIGIAACVTFLSMGGSLKSEIYRETNALGANLMVIPKGSCGFEQLSILTGDQMPTTISNEDVAKIAAIEKLAAIPYLTQKTAINNEPVSVTGVLPEPVKRTRGWQMGQGSYFASLDDIGAVVGIEAAERFGLKPGGHLTLRGQRVPVTGVLAATGGKDDVTIFLPLPLAQRVFNAADRVSYIAVVVADLALMEPTIEKIRAATGLGVVTDKQMLKSVLAIAGSVNVTLQLIAAVSVLAAAFGIVNTMLTATYERKREIGVLLALGATRRTIFSIFVLESGVYGILGGLAGVATGLLAATVTAPYISDNAFTAFMRGSGQGPLLDVGIIVGSVAVSAAVAVVAGLYPAWRAARLSPVEAISYE